jgi:hypothetical protein
VTRRDSETPDRRRVDAHEERLTRARVAFNEGLREASDTGARAARRLIAPALWGAALLGGSLLALAMLQVVRRPSARPALLRVSIEPRFEGRALLPAIGGAVARLALQHLLAAATSPRTGSPGAGSPERDEARRSLAPEAPPAAPQRNGSNHSNGSSARSAKT